MSRRKHILQKVLQNDIDPPSEGQSIVRAVGSRGSNIMEVEFPDKSRTLCLLPAKFHKKLWIKRGNFLIIEDAQDADAAVTGQIVAVLFADTVKEFKKMDGVWPHEFLDNTNYHDIDSIRSDDDSNSDDSNDDDDDDDDDGLASSLQKLDINTTNGDNDDTNNNNEGNNDNNSDNSDDSDDSDLPPLEKIQNRKIIEYEISDSDSE